MSKAISDQTVVNNSTKANSVFDDPRIPPKLLGSSHKDRPRKCHSQDGSFGITSAHTVLHQPMLAHTRASGSKRLSYQAGY